MKRTLTTAEEQERQQLRQRSDAFSVWLGKRNNYKAEEVPAGLEMPNGARSRLEVLDFIADPPTRYFAYVQDVPGMSPAARSLGLTPKLARVITWIGDTLANVTWTGDAWRDNFGGERVPFRCEAINGLSYSGVYYKSAGNYCRLRLLKTPPPRPSDNYARAENLVRSCRFTPYRRGMGPAFTLHVWDTNTRDHMGKNRLAYQLRQHEAGCTRILFDGADFCCAPGQAIDSDACIECLMGFLTLRPGDTDSEYFDSYTEEQKEFCEQHAETLSCEVHFRFCGENGNLKK